MTQDEFNSVINQIAPLDEQLLDRARRRQAALAKPPGSLGALEDYAVRLAGITGRLCPKMDRCRVLVFAADNGVVAEGVSSAPPSVTLALKIAGVFGVPVEEIFSYEEEDET